MLKNLVKIFLLKIVNFFLLFSFIKNYLKTKFKTDKFIITPYYAICLNYLCNAKKLYVVQVGAGLGNELYTDPLRQFFLDYNEEIKAILFEPQIDPFNKLKDTFKNFKTFEIYNSAIGNVNKSELRPFYIYNQNFRELYKRKGKSFSTGTQSFIKENLLMRIKRNISSNENCDDYISTKFLEMYNLKYFIEQKKIILPQSSNENKLILQVDAEGMDDEVIYGSSINFYKFDFINYENKNLSTNKRTELEKFLKNSGYKVVKWANNDNMAMKLFSK
jgi:hypothetical protein